MILKVPTRYLHQEFIPFLKFITEVFIRSPIHWTRVRLTFSAQLNPDPSTEVLACSWAIIPTLVVKVLRGICAEMALHLVPLPTFVSSN